ncbi:MAG TPA: hypothetical protein VFR37_20115 [Longimicrobium sp.]|nr:hypothetical protein [Longimicrobium sp.]
MRPAHLCFAILLGSSASCGGDGAGDAKSADSTAVGRLTYAECMEVANRQASRAESVTKAGECMRLPDAPPDSTLPPDIPPPPGTGEDTAAAGAIRSAYTPLDEAQCRVTDFDEESQSSTSRCPGVAGHVLNVHDGDLRASIDIVTPDGRAHELNYWHVITSGFSGLGPRAEWRMRGERPIALIVRVNASENPEDSSIITSYLAVAKITARQICVTDRIAPAPDANEAARRAADASADRPCLSSVP